MSQPAGVLRAGLLPEPLIFERGAPGRMGAICDPTEVSGPASVDVVPSLKSQR